MPNRDFHNSSSWKFWPRFRIDSPRWGKEARELREPGPRLRFPVVHGCIQTDQSTIRTVSINGIRLIENLPEIRWLSLATALIPIKDQMFIHIFMDHIFVDYNMAPVWTRNRGIPGMNRIPAGSGQTVLRRMNGVSGSLANVIAEYS